MLHPHSASAIGVAQDPPMQDDIPTCCTVSDLPYIVLSYIVGSIVSAHELVIKLFDIRNRVAQLTLNVLLSAQYSTLKRYALSQLMSQSSKLTPARYLGSIRTLWQINASVCIYEKPCSALFPPKLDPPLIRG